MKTSNIFIWIMLIIGLTACSEEEVNNYSANEGIYFNQRIRVGNILTDSLVSGKGRLIPRRPVYIPKEKDI